MEALVPHYGLPLRAVLEAVDGLGLISERYRFEQGEEAQKKYLLQQYLGFRATCEQRRLKAASQSTEEAPPQPES
jgi:hypothetical protein